jgi:serine/threonine-protein kinase
MAPSTPQAALGQTIDASPLVETVTDLQEKTVISGSVLRIGRYVLLRKVGEGAMGMVYAAYDEDLDRKVAIKVVHPDFQQNREFRVRIVREAQALARVSAPNVVQVYEVGEVGNQMYIVMEFVGGTTLTSWQAAQKHSWQEILRMYCAAGQGLLAAHDAGLAHRDFKPDNVLVGSDGRPRVVDFGLARLAGTTSQRAEPTEQEPQAANLKPATGQPQSLTQAGSVVGTPLYMSPEQHEGKLADSRSDQFSFCVALFEALYGYLPFNAKNSSALRYNLLTGKLQPRPANSPVPVRVHEALVRGLDTDPSRRFPSIRELLGQLYFDEEHDPAAAPGARRMVTVHLFLVTLIVSIALSAVTRLGADPRRAALTTATGFFLAICALSFWFRQVLMGNTFHRTIVIAGLVFSGQQVGHRLVGLVLRMSPEQFFAIDLVSITAMICLLSAMTLPRLWPTFPLGLGASLLAISRPEFARILGEVLIPATVLVVIAQWNLAALHKAKGPQ